MDNGMAEAQISLIVTACDRADHVNDLAESLHDSAFHIVVADEKPWMNYADPYDEYVCAALPFNLARWRNLGAMRANRDILFFCDADMLLPPTFARECRKNVSLGQVWFPMCIDMMEDGGAEPDWRESAWGNCGIMRADFEKTGGWNEGRTTGGKEDGDFRDKVRDGGLTVVRKHLDGVLVQPRIPCLAHDLDVGTGLDVQVRVARGRALTCADFELHGNTSCKT